MIRIDGYDIKTQWGLCPKYGGLYDKSIPYGESKDRISNDWDDEDGLEILASSDRSKGRTVIFEFLCDSQEHYKLFIEHLISAGFFELYTDIVNEISVYEYLSCSDYNQNTFSIKAREWDEDERHNPFGLIKEEDETYITTEDGLIIWV